VLVLLLLLLSLWWLLGWLLLLLVVVVVARLRLVTAIWRVLAIRINTDRVQRRRGHGWGRPCLGAAAPVLYDGGRSNGMDRRSEGGGLRWVTEA
jgi:hypothetical protein